MNDRVADLQKRDLAHIWHPCSQMKDYETLRPIMLTTLKAPTSTQPTAPNILISSAAGGVTF